MPLCIDNSLFCADLRRLPIEHISQFRLKGGEVALTRRFIRHLRIFPDQPDTDQRGTCQEMRREERLDGYEPQGNLENNWLHLHR